MSVSRVFNGNQSAFIDAWDLTNAVDSSAALVAVSVTMGTGLAAYALSFATCHLHIMRGALAPPLILVTPLVLTLLLASPICEALVDSICEWDSDYVIFYLVGGICFAVAHLGFTWRLFHSDPVLLLQESKVNKSSFILTHNGIGIRMTLINIFPNVNLFFLTQRSQAFDITKQMSDINTHLSWNKGGY